MQVSSNDINWDLDPFVGVGPLKFGMTRSEVRQSLGPSFTEFKKSKWSENTTDDFSEYGLHAYYDGQDTLEFLEFFGPVSIRVFGVRVLGEPVKSVVALAKKNGVKAKRGDVGGMYFNEYGFVIAEDSGPAKIVSAFKKGYYT